MRLIMFLLIIIFAQHPIMAQNHTDIKSNISDNGQLQFELKLPDQKINLNNYQNWISSIDESISGKIIRINSKSIIYKGSTLVYLSEKPSTFQTQMFFTLEISQSNEGINYVIKEIHYKSLPEYGKQGTASLHTQSYDWFAPNKLYRKSGKMRRINQNLMNSSTKLAEELLLFGLDY